MLVAIKNLSFIFKSMLLFFGLVNVLFAGGLVLEPTVDGDILLSFTTQEDVQLITSGDEYLIEIDGFSGDMDAGMPDLPVFVKVLDGKANESLEVGLLSSEYVTVTQNIDVAAVSIRETVALGPANSVTRDVRSKNSSIYTNNVFWPEKQVFVTEAWQGNRKLLRVAICPVQYNPVSKVLRICRKLEAILKTVPSIDQEGPRGPIRAGRK